MSMADEIGKLKHLKDEGALTEQEFEMAKRKLLQGQASEPAPSGQGAASRRVASTADNGLRQPRQVNHQANNMIRNLLIATVAIIGFWYLFVAIQFMGAKRQFDRQFDQMNRSSPFGGSFHITVEPPNSR